MECAMQQPSQHPIQQPAPPYAAPSGSSSLGASVAPFAHDDALIGPPSPGLALVRLLQIEARLPASWSGLRAEIKAAHQALSQAVAHSQQVQSAMDAAHALLSQVWKKVREGEGVGQEAGQETEALCAALGFPPPTMKADEVGAVDVSSVIVTHTRPLRQVLSTIAFADAANATGYRLFETKLLPNGEDYEDATVANYLPSFARVRLAAGEHRFRIESRNPYARTLSEFFTVSVPRP